MKKHTSSSLIDGVRGEVSRGKRRGGERFKWLLKSGVGASIARRSYPRATQDHAHIVVKLEKIVK